MISYKQHVNDEEDLNEHFSPNRRPVVPPKQ